MQVDTVVDVEASEKTAVDRPQLSERRAEVQALWERHKEERPGATAALLAGAAKIAGTTKSPEQVVEKILDEISKSYGRFNNDLTTFGDIIHTKISERQQENGIDTKAADARRLYFAR